MTPDEAFTLFLKGCPDSSLPWELSPEDMHSVFMAGWHAHAESLKQTEMFTGPVAAPCPDAEIAAIYAAYPRKIGKQAALKAIRKALKDKSPAWLLDAVQNYAKATAMWPEEDRKYIPHMATWVNRGSYDDDPQEWVRGTVFKSQFGKTYQ